jgi:hypothetical protein
MRTTHTYVYKLKCGHSSPAMASREATRAWAATHRSNCVIRAGDNSGEHASRSPRRETLDAAAALLADVRARFVERPPESWKDSSRYAWDASTRGNQLLAKTWGGGNCLKGCIASLLNADIAKIPDPERSYAAEADWHGHFNKRLAKATGYRLDFLPTSLCPPRNPNQLWIAGITEPDGDAHAVVARGAFVVHDPSGLYQGSLPIDRINAGMLVVPTKRIVPVFSPARHGWAVMPA